MNAISSAQATRSNVLNEDVMQAKQVRVSVFFASVIVASPLPKLHDGGHSAGVVTLAIFMAVNIEVTVRQKSEFKVCSERLPETTNPVHDMTERVRQYAACAVVFHQEQSFVMTMLTILYFEQACQPDKKPARQASSPIVKDVPPRNPVALEPPSRVESAEDDPEELVATSTSEPAQRESEPVVKDSVPEQSAVRADRELEQAPTPVSYSIADYAKALEEPVNPPPLFSLEDYRKALQDPWADHAAALVNAGIPIAPSQP